MVKFEYLPEITGGEILALALPEQQVEHLLTDSRKLAPTKNSLFIAIKGVHHDGHQFIQPLIDAGISQFIIDQDITLPKSTVNILKVKNSLQALQALARHKRALFTIPVIGITGSNGKTIVKEWLGQLLSPYQSVVKSPGSFNSQLGVPLSVWPMAKNHELAIFEAGISLPGEMARLEKIIQPTIGIFTNIGSAHDEGFASMEQKIAEKAVLFRNAEKVIYCKDHKAIDQQLHGQGFTWGHDQSSDIVITERTLNPKNICCHLTFNQKPYDFIMPFTSAASFDNAMHCVAFMLWQGYDQAQIQAGLYGLKTVKMRLELKRGINGCQLIDDTYNSDLAGLQVALDFLVSQKQLKSKTVIISDMLQTGMQKDALYQSVYQQIQTAHPNKIIAIGQEVSAYFKAENSITTYPTVDRFLQEHDFSTFEKELILVKGARPFAFEKIVSRLEEKIHGTHLEINLDALTNNLNFYRSKLNPGTMLMVMVKAFAYGSGSLEIANLLQHHRVDYLGVAYADEGVTLRNNGITLPVMVMNPSEESFSKLLAHNLEPELYNLDILKKFIDHVGDQPAAIHIKLDTGMHRLGFKSIELEALANLLLAHPKLSVKSIFSHLAGADEAVHNDYSRQQAEQFQQMSDQLMTQLGIKTLRHLVNSPGIIRFPEYHFDMVRLGIGLYGIEATNNEQQSLLPISSLKTIVSQVNHLKANETVGYGRKGKVSQDAKVATIAIGYADGFGRAFSNGVGQVFIHGKKVPVLGNVCMDMTMIDVSGIDDVQEGDEVEIFGNNITISEMAGYIGTIPYEVLTNVSQRVKRVYYTG